MGKNHIKRLAAPKTWPINRKRNIWVARPTTGTHNLNSCIALSVLLKEVLVICKTSREVKQLLNNEKIKVNGIIRKDKTFPIGLMDIIEINKNYYRIFFNKRGKLVSISIPGKESNIIPKKVINKTSLKNKKLQINMFDGSNILSSSKDNIKTYDTLIIENGKIKQKIDFEKGSFVYITGGRQIGKSGVLKEIETRKDFQSTKIIFNDGEKDFETLKDYAFVVGKSKPVITLPNE